MKHRREFKDPSPSLIEAKGETSYQNAWTVGYFGAHLATLAARPCNTRGKCIACEAADTLDRAGWVPCSLCETYCPASKDAICGSCAYVRAQGGRR